MKLGNCSRNGPTNSALATRYLSSRMVYNVISVVCLLIHHITVDLFSDDALQKFLFLHSSS